jgi:hypothetical protein
MTVNMFSIFHLLPMFKDETVSPDHQARAFFIYPLWHANSMLQSLIAVSQIMHFFSFP